MVTGKYKATEFGDKSILRFAGGKQRLVDKLVLFLPEDISSRRYFEPFLGGGALFFKLKPSTSFLSDLNNNLIKKGELESVNIGTRRLIKSTEIDRYIQDLE